MRGIFITFEGCDGTGKTTQIKLLAEYLSKNGYTVVCTREPGGTSVGNEIRGLLLDPAKSFCPRSEALLYMAARAEHVSSFIRPNLEAGKVVLSDRFADSTFVYQGAARHIAFQELKTINDFAANGLVPDITILLDAETQKVQERIEKRGNQDRFDREAMTFHQTVRDGFLEIARREPERVKIVNALQSIDEVHHTIKKVIDAFLAGGKL